MEAEISNSVTYELNELDLHSWRSVKESLDSFLVTIPTVLGFILSRLLCGHLPLKSTRRFLLEFLLIGLPTVILVTVGSAYTYTYSLVVSIAIVGYIYGNVAPNPLNHKYEIGKRPIVFTLLRATAYSGTCAAILAVDFPSYPTDYRKSRSFGASAMDMGIGLFVVTMGLVSHRTRNSADLRKLPRSVVPLLVLGLARTIVITAIDYHQDESEYGKHLNAFFTLGLTKLMGSLYSLLVNSDKQLLGLSLGLLFLNELVLQSGLGEFVMSSAPHEGFLSANREGLSSLHGCVALYLLSIYFARWYTSQDTLSYQQFTRKLRVILLVAIHCWIMVFISAYLTGIARVTFNFGYVIWIVAVCLSLVLIFAYFFELKLVKSGLKNKKSAGDSEQTSPSLPSFVESLNINGLTHFMLSNFLTGMVNMTLDPGHRNNMESVAILCIYMFFCAGVVFIMMRKSVRIA
ncbi:phosphatidylinositol-glycan biosynthesis class W protein [Drosophila rhopaloa]|uniref:Phosphatidylinositol-glycan biosynthesis class W protein n=1 Tax=Drosophila rhopaloa TaxID=1041015 RepID=A0A6P4F7R1_DRORH|nr:phosphatidylinositol-glycan biosynthesis class W protein [Drosophila rhopaloa]